MTAGLGTPPLNQLPNREGNPFIRLISDRYNIVFLRTGLMRKMKFHRIACLRKNQYNKIH